MEGAEVEALDFGAVVHAVALDGAAEGGDEGLGVDGVVGGGLGFGVWEGESCCGSAFGVVGEREDFGFDVEADAGGVGCAGSGFGKGAARAGAVEVGVEVGEVEELLDVRGDVGAGECLVRGEGYGYG